MEICLYLEKMGNYGATIEKSNLIVVLMLLSWRLKLENKSSRWFPVSPKNVQNRQLLIGGTSPRLFFYVLFFTGNMTARWFSSVATRGTAAIIPVRPLKSFSPDACKKQMTGRPLTWNRIHDKPLQVITLDAGVFLSVTDKKRSSFQNSF